MMFRYVLLGLLAETSGQHGYALTKRYHALHGTAVSTGNVYRELQRLVAEGLVQTVSRSEDGDPRRAPYSITESGLIALTRWLRDPAPDAGGDADEIGPRLPFLPLLAPGDVRQVLQRWRDDLWAATKAAERMRTVLLSHPNAAASTDFPASTLLLTRRIRRLSAEIGYLEEVREAFETHVARVSPPGPEEVFASSSSRRTLRARAKRQ